jgi:2C-methyl-D-erythritol 2,4-cyclodiphosphate synthase
MNQEAIIDAIMQDDYLIDINDYMNDEAQAELLREIIAINARYKYENSFSVLENQAERLALIIEQIEKTIAYYVMIKERD